MQERPEQHDDDIVNEMSDHILIEKTRKMRYLQDRFVNDWDMTQGVFFIGTPPKSTNKLI